MVTSPPGTAPTPEEFYRLVPWAPTAAVRHPALDVRVRGWI